MKKIIFITRGTQAERELVADLIAFQYKNTVKINGNFSDLIEPDMCAFDRCKPYTDLLVINHIGVGRIYPLARVITGHIAVKRYGKPHFFINPDAVVVCSDMVNHTNIADNFPAGTFSVLDAEEMLLHTATTIVLWKK